MSLSWGARMCRVRHFCSFWGFDPLKFVTTVSGIPTYIRDIRSYRRQSPSSSFQIRLSDLNPVLNERTEEAGAIGGHYFHQDLWAARMVFQAKPHRHVDIGSRIDGFVAHVLSFMPVTLVDIRSIKSHVSGLEFIQDDATELRAFPDESIISISSLHAAEHFGLGRYSDPVEPGACFRFMSNLQRVLSPNGRLYFSVPIGRERVNFNAHRVFAVNTILSTFSRLTLLSFSYVDDAGELHEQCALSAIPSLEHGCGLFEFTKASN
jgi:hypothetical protein